MKRFLLIPIVLLTLQKKSWAQTCELSTEHRIFLVGELHGSDAALEMKNRLIPSSFKKQIYLGLEIDPEVMKKALNPENRNAIFGMEESFSKGFGVLFWSWWLSESRLLMPSLSYDRMEEAFTSFHYFTLSNPHLQQAWRTALNDSSLQTSRNPLVKGFIAAIESSLANKINPDLVGLPIPLSSRDALKASSLVVKAVLRAYVEMAIALPADTAEFYIPKDLHRMKEMLDFPAIIPGDKNFYIYQRWIFLLSMQFKQKFLLDWRSEQMTRSILRHLCEAQTRGAENIPTVITVGLDHLRRMEEVLKLIPNVRVSLEVPPQVTSDFAKLLEKIK